MTGAKFEHSYSKVRARVDHPTNLMTTVPEKIAHAMKLQAGDSIDWIWITRRVLFLIENKSTVVKMDLYG